MTAETITLTDFLLQRIAADEAVALAATVSPAYRGSFGETAAEEIVRLALSEGAEQAGADHFENWMPARVLAECAAKRRIVEAHPMMPVQERTWGQGGYFDGCCETCTAGGEFGGPTADGGLNYCNTLCALASVYADHDDFDPRWAG